MSIKVKFKLCFEDYKPKHNMHTEVQEVVAPVNRVPWFPTKLEEWGWELKTVQISGESQIQI